eukprot:6403961-Alexandrium_andersonii.AAC.1
MSSRTPFAKTIVNAASMHQRGTDIWQLTFQGKSLGQVTPRAFQDKCRYAIGLMLWCAMAGAAK